MALPVWPATLPAKPLRAGLDGRAPAPMRRLPMETGQSRARALFVSSPCEIETGWRMTAEQFARFKAFYTGDLDFGTKWFSAPLWTGGAVAPVEAFFAERWRAAPRAAAAVTVTARLRLRALPFAPVAGEILDGFFGADGMPEWPAALPAAPLQDGHGLDPHRPLQVTDFEDGPKAAVNPFPPSPAEQTPRWTMSPAQFETFKAFHALALKQGAVWFRLPLWFGPGLQSAEARFTGPFSFAPHGTFEADGAARILVTAPLEQRRLPVASEAALAFLEALTGDGFAGFAAGIHEFVHETWPEAF
ncbi:hypothetical protein [Parvibaculum sp.]|uniref:hypothetical protein n=1 Tax=Parvibaculum sp. TaxID=2024848 RepID=UPI00261B50A1|nr:hypothetical protein [Parvibaculum sp.]MCW5727254.1 hypothetical protein [Parvibaculum sp.]